MKKLMLAMFVILCSTLVMFSQTRLDVVTLKNGDTYKGQIIKDVPGDYLQLEMMDGSIKKIMYSDIDNRGVENSPINSKSDIESWYLILGLGYSDISYPDELQGLIDELKKASNVSHLPLNINIGFYWPLNNKKTMLGAVINGDGDAFSSGSENMQINTYLMGGSAVFHLMDILGKGVYLRADAGLAFSVVTYSLGESYSSDMGFGLRLGGGYAIPISSGTRILIDLGYTYKNIESNGYGTLSFGAAFMF